MIGALVTCKQTGAVLWIVKGSTPEGWSLIRKATDARGYPTVTTRTAGAGDVVVIREAETYSPGYTIENFQGVDYTVLEDRGDDVWLVASDFIKETRGGDPVHVDGGNTLVLSKAELLMATT